MKTTVIYAATEKNTKKFYPCLKKFVYTGGSEVIAMFFSDYNARVLHIKEIGCCNDSVGDSVGNDWAKMDWMVCEPDVVVSLHN